MGDTASDYYVYLLSSEPGPFSLDNIFYVGKGKGLRYESHFGLVGVVKGVGEDRLPGDVKDDEVVGEDVTPLKKEKLEEMKQKYPDRPIEDFVWIAQHSIGQEEAFRLEAFLIQLLSVSLGQGLTNLVAGHHAQLTMKTGGEIRRFFGMEPIEVRRALAADLEAYADDGETTVCMVVKGSREELAKCRRYPETDHGAGVQSATLEETDEVRPGWDNNNPWDDKTAKERASGYWQIGEDTLDSLIRLANDGRLQLGLVVDGLGSSTLRYIWRVRKYAPWYEVKIDGRTRYEVPLGDPFDEHTHPWMGKKLVVDGRGLLSSATGYAVVPSPPMDEC